MLGWIALLLVSAACSYVSISLLAKCNPDESIPWFGSPPVAPPSQLWTLAASVATAWLGASLAAETALGPWGYPLGAAAVGVPWIVVRQRHNARLDG